MNFKPGDKVWIDNGPNGIYPMGTYAGVLIRRCRCGHLECSMWAVDIEGLSVPTGATSLLCPEGIMRKRYDPPDWVKVCKLDSVPEEELA